MSMSESAVQQRIRLAASERGMMIQRNNNGACVDETGRLIRYGLMNDTAELNKEFKSGDLIGITPVVITEAWLGARVGIYTAFECKPEGWHLIPSDDRGAAQLRYHRLVLSYGGLAGFVTGVPDIDRVMRREPL